MASQIEVYTGGTTPADTINGTSISGTLVASGSGGTYDFQYTPTGGSAQTVDLLVANMGSQGADDVLTIDGMPPSGGGTPAVNDIRVTASGAGVSSFLSWSILASGALRVTLQTPAASGDWVLWEFGAAVPLIKLKVKIVRV